MAIVWVFGGRFCLAEEVAAGASERLHLERIDDDLLDRATALGGLARERLQRAMRGPPTLLDRLTHERERATAAIRLALAEQVQRDGLLLDGPVGHLLPDRVTHVLRVCLIARDEHRVAGAMEREGLSSREAERAVQRDDAEHRQWTQRLRDRDPYEASLYDVLMPMDSTTVEDAVRAIEEHAGKPAVRATEEARAAARDFLLAARVHHALAPLGYEIEVEAWGGRVEVRLARYVTRLEPASRKLEEAARAVEGVEEARVVPGTGFVPPNLLRQVDLDLPPRALLVDDERDFVHTLSERLQTRSLESAVVYDGEQALEFIEKEEPEVMVLDLKMPGIDGIEVLRRVKRDHPDVEIIILTGHGSERERALAEDLGAFAYLQKPVDIDRLAEAMRDAYKKAGRPASGPD